jgi:monoamine oxidase
MANGDDVIVIGAGAAGMAAAVELAAAGFSVSILEARDRIGGRVFTQRDRFVDAPIELGAEFIHGMPHEIWQPLQKHKVAITEVSGDNWCSGKAGLSRCDFFSQVDALLQKMDDRSADESFVDFMERQFPSNNDPKQEEVKRRALDYVSGFNAADPALVSVHWLVREMHAEEKIEGDRAFRSKNGYDDLVEIFRHQLAEAPVSVRTDTVVERIRWRRGEAEVMARAPRGAVSMTARRVLVTLPLAVLQSAPGEVGAIEFVPALPPQKVEAMRKLEMGKVIRIVLRFRERFWESISPEKSKTLSDMSFLFSHDEWFPTWWTRMPEKLPIITGWAPFRAAELLSGKSSEFVVGRSLETLHRLLGVAIQDLQQSLEATYFHDWQSDPFSRGAYSYAKVGADGAQEELGRPLEGTLFFAGEATDVSGHNGTVHGAMASGRRAAKEIVQIARQQGTPTQSIASPAPRS